MPQLPLTPRPSLIPQNVSQSAKRLKTIIAAIAATIFLTLAILFYALIIHPKNQINALDAKYQTITRPSTYAHVLQTMGPNLTSDEPGTGTAFWDDQYPSPNETESKNITRILRYQVPLIYLGVTFEFTFDKDNNLIGKHRYD